MIHLSEKPLNYGFTFYYFISVYFKVGQISYQIHNLRRHKFNEKDDIDVGLMHAIGDISSFKHFSNDILDFY